MKWHKETDRTASLERMIPDLYDHKTVLYIGARSDRSDYLQEFLDAGCRVTVIEVFKKNVKELEKIEHPNLTVAQMDVEFFPVVDKPIYDIVFWWHGPEHAEDPAFTIAKLEYAAGVAVVMGCPWGHVKQRVILGNPWEEHKSLLGHQFFEDQGYETECLGNKDEKGSNITAVKYV